MKQRNSRARFWSRSCAGATAAACLLIGAPLGFAPDAAQAAPEAPEPVASFDFDAPAVDGAYAGAGAIATVNGTEVLEPGADGQGTAARLGKNFWLDVTNGSGASPLAGLDAATISYDSLPDTSGNTGWAVYAARTAAAPVFGKETYLGTLDTAAKLSVERYANTGSRDATGNLSATRTAGAWQHVDIVLDGSTARLYVDAQLVDKKEQGPALSEILGDTGGVLQLGKANWGGGEYFSGLIDNVTITPAALTAAQLGAPSPEAVAITGTGIEQGESGATLAAWEGETTRLTATVTPAGAESDVVWESTDAAVAEVSDTGALLAVAPGTATITASAAGDAAVQASVDVTVAAVTPESSAERDAQALSVPAEVRGDFSLQRAGAQGSTVTWELLAGAEQAVIADGVSAESFTVQVDRPAAGDAATELLLRATVANGDARVTREFDTLVQPLPAEAGDDEAYVWAFFTGEGVGGEKISLAASKGNDALDWNTLNGGEPLFTSTLGEQGLRDPFILRSPDGDTFYMIATDLKIDGRAGGFTGAQTHGSLAIEVWESTDLVNWSDQRHIEVSTGYAGNTWAPEAYWDDELGLYVVYWASNLYDSDDQAAHGTTPNYNRMMVATTPDFVEFSEPEVWIDVDRRGQAGAGSIDVTVAKHGDAYYRVYKDEKSMTLRQEHSNDLLATVAGSYPATTGADDEWVEDGTQIGNGQPNGYGGTFSAGEGPSLFPANPGDVNGYEYYLFADQPNYHGGPNHYVPMATTDITDASQWQVIGDELPAAQLPVNSDGGKPRHGTIVPVTRAQYEGVLAAFAPDVAIVSAAPVEVSTAIGVAPVLPETVALTTGTDETVDAAVVWDEVPADAYAAAGVFTVSGVAQDDSRHPVTATVTVGDASNESDAEASGEADAAGEDADAEGGTAGADGGAADTSGGSAHAGAADGSGSTADTRGGEAAADGAQATASGDAHHLASTGGSSLWPLAGGAALVVLVAFALLLVARRRAAAQRDGQTPSVDTAE
ncbi:LamG-like jellyroll fold domain-containing protein [Leucobacter sp. gxy201]|uniref:LamG-like jellyroll fold domain-containing protein n=1 Tax=Leucobacter sp. gxy201 TaxID=2957200 RepID=UPI003DA1AB9F